MQLYVPEGNVIGNCYPFTAGFTKRIDCRHNRLTFIRKGWASSNHSDAPLERKAISGV